MLSVELDRPGSIRVVEVADPEVVAGTVLVAVDAVGICATDLHLVEGHFPSARYPVRPGHEFTGVVVESLPAGAGPATGTRVCVDPGVPCRACRACRIGRTNLCENRRALGISLPGGAAELALVPAENCYPVTGDLAPEVAVLCEPLACVVHAIDRIPERRAPERAVVLGAGTIGLLAGQVLADLGAGRVDIIDPDDRRHPLAQKMALGAVASDAATLGGTWDVVVDASGAPAAIEAGLDHIRTGGTLVQLGVAPVEATVPLRPFDVFARELTVVGSMTTLHSFDRALRMLESGRVDVEPLTGAPYSLAAYPEALDAARRGETVKTWLRPGH